MVGPVVSVGANNVCVRLFPVGCETTATEPGGLVAVHFTPVEAPAASDLLVADCIFFSRLPN